MATRFARQLLLRSGGVQRELEPGCACFDDLFELAGEQPRALDASALSATDKLQIPTSFELDLDALFELGLARLLDGFTPLIEQPTPKRRRATTRP